MYKMFRKKNILLNEKKASKILKSAAQRKPNSSKRLSGTLFSAQEILSSPYANAGLYCLDADKAITALNSCNSQNAQGEIYLTDALEWFASKDSVAIYEVKSAEDMLTFSTKPELRRMSLHFMKTASTLAADMEDGQYDNVFTALYGSTNQKQRYIALLTRFIPPAATTQSSHHLP